MKRQKFGMPQLRWKLFRSWNRGDWFRIHSNTCGVRQQKRKAMKTLTVVRRWMRSIAFRQLPDEEGRPASADDSLVYEIHNADLRLTAAISDRNQCVYGFELRALEKHVRYTRFFILNIFEKKIISIQIHRPRLQLTLMNSVLVWSCNILFYRVQLHDCPMSWSTMYGHTPALLYDALEQIAVRAMSSVNIIIKSN